MMVKRSGMTGAKRMEQVGRSDAPAIPLGYLLVLSALACGISIALFYPTFRYDWAFDDIEYINVSASVLAGRSSLWSAILLAHDEHVVPLFRLIFFVYLKLFGMNVVLWRVMAALVHAWSALCLGLVAWRYSGKSRAGVAATIAYVLPCGLSAMWTWYPAGAAVLISFAAFTGASALLAWRGHLRMRRIVAGVAVLAGLLFWRSFAPMALLPAVIDEIERRNAGARRFPGPFTIYSLGAIIAVVAGGMRLITVFVDSNIVHGVPRALFLFLMTPFRLFFPGLKVVGDNWDRSTALLGAALGIAAGSIILAFLAALWRNGMPRLARVAALSTIPAFGVLLLIGLFRFHSEYYQLIEEDRYFYPMFVPVALLAGAIASSISFAGWSRIARFAVTLGLIAGVCSEFVLHRRAMLHRFPAAIYARYGRHMASIRLLVHRLEVAGGIEIPRNLVWFDEVDRGIDTAVLTHLLSDGKRLRLGNHVDAVRLNALLDAWAQEIGEKVPYVRLIAGSLVNLHLFTETDFGTSSYSNWVSGFLEWEKPFRWMMKRGELVAMLATSDVDVRLAAPMSDLRRVHPDWMSIPVRVSIRDEETGFTVFLGIANITADGVQQYRFPNRELLTRFGPGRITSIVLECDRAWTPFEVYGARDRRERTVQVYSGGTRFSDWKP
jgi:hypothetical protein